MMTMMPDFAIIIPAYNEEELLAETLSATREAMAGTDRHGELIVVDNNSTDDTGTVARNCGADLVVFEPRNQIARARNAGAATTDAQHLVFVDADTTINTEILKRALDLLEGGKVAAGGARVVVDQKVTPVVGFLVSLWNFVAAQFHFAAGSFFFCRRDVFDEVGGFAEEVYAGEEVLLARRIKKWARRRKMSFHVIPDLTATTSGRKSDWFSTWDFIRQLAILFLIPGAAKNRKLCAMWYRRPAEGGGES